MSYPIGCAILQVACRSGFVVCLQPMPGRQHGHIANTETTILYWKNSLCSLVVIHVDVDNVRDEFSLQLVKLLKLRIVAAL